MLKRLLAIFKIGWLCQIVTKGIEGLTAAKTVLEYIKSVLEGSTVGKKVIPYIEKLIAISSSLVAALEAISSTICGIVPAPVAVNKAMSVDEAAAIIGNIVDELDELIKK